MSVADQGSVPGRYEILDKLGQGGMGAVYLVRDRLYDRKVALKVILGDASPQVVDRFILEARATAALEHPAMVPTYDISRDGPNLYFTMRPIEGRTLGAIEQSLRQRVRALAQVARGVAYAHQRGRVHRDLKPDNVMVGTRGEVSILDWGLVGARGSARRAVIGEQAEHARMTLDGQIMGTPAYMSPEQASGDQAAVGPASDIYALGAILYELLTETPPFQGPVREVLGQVSAHRLTPPSQAAPELSIPPELEAICLHAMAHRPADRYATADALAEDLEAWLGGRTVSVLPPPWPARLGRALARHPYRTTAALLTLAAGLAAGAILHLERRRQADARQARIVEERRRRHAELGARLADARGALSRTDAAMTRWRAAFAAWREHRADEDRRLSGRLVLPRLKAGQPLLRGEGALRVKSAELMRSVDWKGITMILRNRRHQQTETESRGVGRGFDRWREMQQSRSAWLQSADETSHLLEMVTSSAEGTGWRPRWDPRLGRRALARMRLEVLLAEARAAEAEQPASAEGSVLRWQAVTEELRTQQRQLVAPPETPLARLQGRARRLLTGLTTLEITGTPRGVTAVLYRYTGALLWASARRGTKEFDSLPNTGLQIVRAIPPAGCRLELPSGEYLLKMTTASGGLIRHVFLLERGVPLRLSPRVPDRIPPGTIYVPGGRYVAGGDLSSALPRHRGTLTPYFIQESEVTLGAYRRFLDDLWASGQKKMFAFCLPRLASLGRSESLLIERQPDGRWTTRHRGFRYPSGSPVWSLPVMGVSYMAATAYARWWTARHPDWAWHLPSAQQWAFAAGGPSGRRYPWGQRFERFRANCVGLKRVPMMNSAGRFFPQGRSPFGLFQMAGNVSELTATPLDASHVEVRGGSFFSQPVGVRVDRRLSIGLTQRVGVTGFRLACRPAGNR